MKTGVSIGLCKSCRKEADHPTDLWSRAIADRPHCAVCGDSLRKIYDYRTGGAWARKRREKRVKKKQEKVARKKHVKVAAAE